MVLEAEKNSKGININSYWELLPETIRGLELIFLVASLGGGHKLTIQMHRQRTLGNFACGIKAETFIILYHTVCTLLQCTVYRETEEK